MELNKKYQIIYADPAWSFKGKGVYQETFPQRKQTRKKRLVTDIYKTMSKKQIEQLPIKDISSNDCALFLWVTDSHLKDGIELIEKWGFTYRTIVFIWKKITNKGNTCANIGAWTMKNYEICLLGIKGNMLKNKKANNIFQLIEAERTIHSQKPNEARNRIIKLFGNLPRIELFARQKTNGWDVWGNEVENSIDLSSVIKLRKNREECEHYATEENLFDVNCTAPFMPIKCTGVNCGKFEPITVSAWVNKQKLF